MKIFKAGIKLKGEYKLVVENSSFKVYDENGNELYYENSSGYWHRAEYDKNVNRTYFENSNGYWSRIEYDENGNIICFERSSGYWYKREYDENGNELYFENSDGAVIDSRPKKEFTVEEIENKLGYKIKIIGKK